MAFPTTGVLLAGSVAACLFAFAKGGVAERIGAAVIAASLVVATVSFSAFRNPVIDLGIDAAAAAALLLVAVRYASVWLGAAMLVYALQFGLDAVYLVTDRPLDRLHAVVNNLDSLAITMALALGAASAWRRRRRPAAGRALEAAP